MKFTHLFALLALAAYAFPANAASISIEAPLAGADAPFLLPVVFTPDKALVNAVEGSISVPDGVSIDGIDTAGSAFALFASGPVYVPASHSIEFTAGAPGGLSGETPALLFIVKAHAMVPGTYTLAPKSVSAYLNDGNGTKLAVGSAPSSVTVGEKGSVNVDAFPKPAPAPLIAEAGKDASLFNGKWFVTFYGGNEGDSVDYYEVREGWWRTPVRAERYYVLKDQGRGSTLWVTAVSRNGNTVTAGIPAANPWTERLVLAAIVLVALILAWLLLRRLRRAKI